MSVEIERKFLVAGEGWRDGVRGVRVLRQAYLARGERASVRVRIEPGVGAWLTVKGPPDGPARPEYEWAIDEAEAEGLEGLAEGRVIEKRRHLVPMGDLTWEVDVFTAPEPLVLAEVELPAPDHPFARPDWLGAEVTGDVRYTNAHMALSGNSGASPARQTDQ